MAFGLAPRFSAVRPVGGRRHGTAARDGRSPGPYRPSAVPPLRSYVLFFPPGGFTPLQSSTLSMSRSAN
jgi:hypothetical protein